MIMKIEKISDNQIRCTLTRADLADRQLQLSELAYGTEKAKSLFRDMMQQAAFEFGFEAEDIPLMIEAIPSADSIVLIITKVEDPEELDTRFSKFAPSSIADAKKKNTPGKLEGAEGLLDLLGKVQESFEAQAAQTPKAASETSDDNTDKKDSGNNIRLFSVSQSFQCSSSSRSTFSRSFSGTLRMISPFLIKRPSPTPPAIPISASFASPGPFTTHPITATFRFNGISATISST